MAFSLPLGMKKESGVCWVWVNSAPIGEEWWQFGEKLGKKTLEEEEFTNPEFRTRSGGLEITTPLPKKLSGTSRK